MFTSYIPSLFLLLMLPLLFSLHGAFVQLYNISPATESVAKRMQNSSGRNGSETSFRFDSANFALAFQLPMTQFFIGLKSN